MVFFFHEQSDGFRDSDDNQINASAAEVDRGGVVAS